MKVLNLPISRGLEKNLEITIKFSWMTYDIQDIKKRDQKDSIKKICRSKNLRFLSCFKGLELMFGEH